jgi:hypothetical protein
MTGTTFLPWPTPFWLGGARVRRRIWRACQERYHRATWKPSFCPGGLASITRLEFVEVDFVKHSMTDLVDGFRQSGHAGGTLQTLMFAVWNVEYEKGEITVDAYDCRSGGRHFPESSRASDAFWRTVGRASAGAGRGVGTRGAPCARTLRTVVLSEQFLEPADIEPLQAVLLHATVTLGKGGDKMGERMKMAWRDGRRAK